MQNMKPLDAAAGPYGPVLGERFMIVIAQILAPIQVLAPIPWCQPGRDRPVVPGC